ncbi:hypothetical protein [Pedobacter steynii]
MKKLVANKNNTTNKTVVRKVQDKTGPKKFKLLELMNNLTHSAYKAMRRDLPKLIGKCINTLDNYSYISIDSNEDIPYHVALKIEKYFGIQPGSLSNLPI